MNAFYPLYINYLIVPVTSLKLNLNSSSGNIVSWCYGEFCSPIDSSPLFLTVIVNASLANVNLLRHKLIFTEPPPCYTCSTGSEFSQGNKNPAFSVLLSLYMHSVGNSDRPRMQHAALNYHYHTTVLVSSAARIIWIWKLHFSLHGGRWCLYTTLNITCKFPGECLVRPPDHLFSVDLKGSLLIQLNGTGFLLQSHQQCAPGFTFKPSSGFSVCAVDFIWTYWNIQLSWE